MKKIKSIYNQYFKFINNLNQKKPFLGFFIHFNALIIIMILVFKLSSGIFLDLTVVRGHSMETTLYEGNRLVILKSEVVLKNLFGQYVPDRGDIIIFNKIDPYDKRSKLLIKRVIALPNERIVIKNQTIMIYNQQHPNGFIPNIKLADELNTFPTDELFETRTGANEVFVLGDNRPASGDSRTIGNIPLESIQGELLIKILPLNQFQIF